MTEILLRLIIITGASTIFGCSLIISIRYFGIWKKRKALNQEHSLLPLHVWLVALSYCLLLALEVERSFQLNIGTVKLILLSIAVFLGSLAMWAVQIKWDKR